MRLDDALDIDGLERLSPAALSTASVHIAAIKNHIDAIHREQSRLVALVEDDEKWRNRTPRDRLAAMARLERKRGHSWPRAAEIVAKETGWPKSIVQHAAQTRHQQLRKRVAERKRADIERLYRQGAPYAEISARVGVSSGYIATVIRDRIGPKPRRSGKAAKL